MTRNDAVNATYRQEFYHRTYRDSRGNAVCCRVSGKCKTWKTRPDDFRLPVKYGLKECFYIEPHNMDDWLTFDPTDPSANLNKVQRDELSCI